MFTTDSFTACRKAKVHFPSDVNDYIVNKEDGDALLLWLLGIASMSVICGGKKKYFRTLGLGLQLFHLRRSEHTCGESGRPKMGKIVSLK